MDKDILKSLLYEYWHYLVIAVLCFLLLKSCTGGKELRLANDELKTEVKELILSSDKYVAKNNELSSKIVQLEKLKAKVKTEIVYIENKTKSDLKKVPTLNTKQIGNYYQERYKCITIMKNYTKTKVIRISESQHKTLVKMKSYNVDVGEFIRQAIK